jgi:hypothetical protein
MLNTRKSFRLLLIVVFEFTNICAQITPLGQTGNVEIYPLANGVDKADQQKIIDAMADIPKRTDNSAGPRDCADILNEDINAVSGVYTIYPPNCIMCYFHVWCDMDKEGGGWTVGQIVFILQKKNILIIV